MKREMLGLALCGGESRRMGEDKALQTVRGGRTQVEYALELLGLVCDRLAVSVGPSSRGGLARELGVPLVADEPSIKGPMSGVVAGLRLANGLPLMVVACDMPYLEPSIMVQLANRRDTEAMATAFVASDGFPEPMCAIYEPGSLAVLEALSREGKTSLRRFLQEVAVERIALERPQLLASVNDRAQLDEARRRLAE